MPRTRAEVASGGSQPKPEGFFPGRAEHVLPVDAGRDPDLTLEGHREVLGVAESRLGGDLCQREICAQQE